MSENLMYVTIMIVIGQIKLTGMCVEIGPREKASYGFTCEKFSSEKKIYVYSIFNKR